MLGHDALILPRYHCRTWPTYSLLILQWNNSVNYACLIFDSLVDGLDLFDKNFGDDLIRILLKFYRHAGFVRAAFRQSKATIFLIVIDLFHVLVELFFLLPILSLQLASMLAYNL